MARFVSSFRSGARLAIPVLAAILIGCGGGALNSNGGNSGSSSGNNGGAGTTGASGATVSASKGGSVHDTLGRALVVIPANALSANTRIYVTPATTTLPDTPEGLQMLAGTAYELTPDGLFFNKAASLTLAYDAMSLPSGMPDSAVQIYTVVNGAWQPLTDSVANSAHNVSAPLAHFSLYAAFCATSLFSGPAYDVVDLGVLSGDSISSAAGISSDGKIVGQSTSAAGAPRAFLWQSGLMYDLGRRSSDIGARAIGVNSTGLAVGASVVNSSSSFPVKFAYGVVTQLATQFGMTGGTATALNDRGSYVVGNALYSGGALTALSGFVAATGSGALNANDDVAGTASSKAAYWSGGKVVDAGLLDKFDIAIGTAISDDQTLVGVAYNAGESTRTGFLYRGGSMSQIPNVDTATMMVPLGVNAVGQVVGNAITDATSRAFLYSNGSTTLLSSLIPANSGWKIVQASAINNRGQIAATGTRNGTQHALLLTPRPGR